MWYNKYIDIPYKDGGRDASGLDCWGLVRLVYADQFDIQLPSLSEQYSTAKDHQQVSEVLAREKENWTIQNTPEVGDVIVFKMLGTETHVGVYIGENKFLHIREGVDSVVESVESRLWKNRLVGYFKYTQQQPANTLVALPNPLKSKPIVIPVITGTSLEFLGEWLKTEENISQKTLERSIFLLNSKPVFYPQWASTRVSQGDSLEFRAVAGDSGVFRMFAIIALSIAAPYLANGFMSLAGGFGTSIAANVATVGGFTAGLATAGVMMAGSLIINAIAPIPEQPVAPSATPSESQKFINGANNPLSQWGSIPVVLGKTRMTPPLGAYNNVRFGSDDSILNGSGNSSSGGVAGSDTYVDMLLIWGYGPLVIDQATLRIGQIGYYNLDNSGSITGQNYDSAVQVTLDRISEPTADMLSRFNGIYGTDIQQDFPNLTLTYDGLPPTGASYFGGMRWTPQPRPTADTGWSEYGFTQPSDKISVSINFPQGLRSTKIDGDGAGNEYTAPVGLELQYKVGSGAWTPWPGSTAIDAGPGHYTVGGKVSAQTYSYQNSYEGLINEGYGDNSYQYWGTITETISATQNEVLSGTMIPDGFTWTVTLNRLDSSPRWAENDLVSVRVRRTTGSDQEPGGYRYTHTAIIQSVTSIRNATPAVDPSGVKIAKTALTLKATDEVNGQVDGINAVVQTYCKDWDSISQTWVNRGTSNPASLYRYVLQHPANPQPLDDSDLDLVQLQHWHEYCNTQRTVTYNGTAYSYKLEYNSIIAGQQRSVMDTLREIASAGRGSPAMSDGKWSVVIDEPKSTIVQHFSPHNSWGFEASKLLPRMPDALKVQFNDRNSDYVQKEIIVAYTGKDASNAQLLEAISLPGITSTGEAVSHAKWHLAQIKLRPEIYTINTDIEYIVCNRGDRVKLTHWVPQWGAGSGRIKNTYGISSNSLSIFDLDEPVLINPSVQNAIRVRNSSTGQSSEHQVLSQFTISAYSQAGNTISVYTQQNHSLQAGDMATITDSLATVLNRTIGEVKGVILSSGLPVGFTFDVLDSANTNLTSTNGLVKLVTERYGRVVISQPTSLVANTDLFLFGEYGNESQDLIVTTIEPTSGKSARITMVDYGVTSSYNIFTDYSSDTITSSTIFESQTTKVPELLNQVGNIKPILDSTKFISDERVMRVISPGVFEYRMKIPFENPAKLSNDVSSIAAEIYPANNPDASGTITVKVPVTSGSVDFTNLVELEAYRFRLRYETKSGKVGPWTDWYVYGVVGKTNPPATVALNGLGYTELQGGLKLVWNDNAEVDIQYYEVRDTDANWGDEQHLFRGLTTELPVELSGPGITDTWYVKAVDYAGNYSTQALAISYTYPQLPNITDITANYSASSLTEATVTLSWSPVVTSKFGVSAYLLEYAGTSVRVNSTQVTVPANWLGTRAFTVKVIDLLTKSSSGFTKSIDKVAPSPVTDFRVQVIDNNVLLYWKNPERTSLPVAHALIKRSDTAGTWETAEVVGTKSGEFTSFSELVAGEYVYYVAAVDTDNRTSEYVSKAVNVAQPPDFVFYGDHISSFESKTNVVSSYVNSKKYDGELLLPVNTTETYEEHFTAPNPDWVGPSSQVAAGYPYYIQPGISSGSYTEEIDFVNIIGSSQIDVTVLGTNLVGNCTRVVQLYTKAAAGDAYTLTSGFATNFRFVKVVVTLTQVTAGSIYSVSSIYLKLSSKQITEANNITVTGSTILNLTKEFIDISSITLTAGGNTAVNTVYDFKDVVRYCTYAVVGNVCTITLPGSTAHGLVTGQLVKVYFTSGTAPSGRYIITSTPTASTFTFALVTANTSGNVTAYPNSLVVYALNPQNGQAVTAPVSYLIRGY